MKTCLAACLTFLLASTAFADSNWPRYRGPDGSGVTDEKGFPTKWDDKALLWKTPLKGKGQSSPCIWGDRIFMTTAEDNGKKRLVFCVDKNTGKVLWEQVAWTGEPEPTHVMNGWATPTCVTDGQHVWSSFGKAGVHCHTVEGKHVWSEYLGEFQNKSKRGHAASLCLAGDLVVFNGDSETDPWLFGLDQKTGKTVWKTKRPAKEGYSTPILINFDGKQEIVVNSDPYVAGYDPKSGKELWTCKSFAPRGEPAPVFANGLLYVINGQAADLYCVKPGGKGDVTKSHMLWHTPRKGGRDEPGPIVVNGYVLVSNMDGMLTCYEAQTGKELWKERFSPDKLSASPTAADGKVFFQNEAGEVIVIEPGPEFKVVSRNQLTTGGGEIWRTPPVPSAGRWYLRSDKTLYCVGAK